MISLTLRIFFKHFYALLRVVFNSATYNCVEFNKKIFLVLDSLHFERSQVLLYFYIGSLKILTGLYRLNCRRSVHLKLVGTFISKETWIYVTQKLFHLNQWLLALVSKCQLFRSTIKCISKTFFFHNLVFYPVRLINLIYNDSLNVNNESNWNSYLNIL